MMSDVFFGEKNKINTASKVINITIRRESVRKKEEISGSS